MSIRSVAALSCLPVLAACASAPPPPPAPPPVVMAPKEPAIDVAPVPEPPGLLAFGRVNKIDALVKAVGDWTKLPLPGGAELLRSVADDAVAEVVDLGQPVDLAVTLEPRAGGVEPAYAYAVGVKGYDVAERTLGKTHRLVPGENGQVKVLGLGRRGPDASPDAADDPDDGVSCILAHAAAGARLVCSDRGAVERLAPYLARTTPTLRFTSDVHLEVRTEPLQKPLQLASGVARGLVGGGSAPFRELLDAAMAEATDLTSDAQKVEIDAMVASTGLAITTRFDFQGAKSTFAKIATQPTPAAPPAAFWHLPGDADSAFYYQGGEPKLLDHARELVGNVVFDLTLKSGLPDAERKALRDLVADRLFPVLWPSAAVYGKGYDAAGLEKAVAARAKVKPNDVAADAEAQRLVIEQVFGWHLYQVADPLAKVAPLLKDGAQLWNRPAIAKLRALDGAPSGQLALKLSPVPAGPKLPKDTVHATITIPRDDIEDAPAANPGKKPAKPRMIHRKPEVVHVFAIPDGGATWLAFGMDAKLLATKAAAALSTAPEDGTLAKAERRGLLHEGKTTAGGFFTPRGAAVLGAGEPGSGRAVYQALSTLPSKGDAPIFFTTRTEPASATAASGSSISTVTVGRAAIEEMVRLALSAK